MVDATLVALVDALLESAQTAHDDARWNAVTDRLIELGHTIGLLGTIDVSGIRLDFLFEYSECYRDHCPDAWIYSDLEEHALVIRDAFTAAVRISDIRSKLLN